VTFSGKYSHNFGLLTPLWKITFTQCNSGATQKLSLGVNSTIELKKNKNMSLLSNVVVIFSSSMVVLTSNGQFMVVPLFHSASDVQ
jgi:hypothetical protein